jgi:hypothetical protein
MQNYLKCALRILNSFIAYYFLISELTLHFLMVDL